MLYPEYPYPKGVANKRTALRDNLLCFDEYQRYEIIGYLCELPRFNDNNDVKILLQKMVQRYSNFSNLSKVQEIEFIKETKHWLNHYPKSLKLYQEALGKYDNGIFERNCIDDLRLSMELLVKALLKNEKSLENQMSEIGSILKSKNVSDPLRNMVYPIIKYYTDYNNSFVKHNDAVNSKEIRYLIKITSYLKRFFIDNI